MKNCSVCGASLNTGDTSCQTCGTQIEPKGKGINRTIIAVGVGMLVVFSLTSGLLLMNVSPSGASPDITSEVKTVVTDIQPDQVTEVGISDESLIQQGILEYDNGNYDGAVDVFLKALDRDLEGDLLFDAYFYLADSYYYKEMYDDAIINFHKALEERYDYLATVYLAQTYFLVDDTESAENYFDEAFKMDDERSEAYLFYAEYLYYGGDLEGAEKNALIASEKNREDLYAVELLVYIHFDREETEKMDRYYQILSDADYAYIERVTDYINQTE